MNRATRSAFLRCRPSSWTQGPSWCFGDVAQLTTIILQEIFTKGILVTTLALLNKVNFSCGSLINPKVCCGSKALSPSFKGQQIDRAPLRIRPETSRPNSAKPLSFGQRCSFLGSTSSGHRLEQALRDNLSRSATCLRSSRGDGLDG